jgi:hypothetical protein
VNSDAASVRGQFERVNTLLPQLKDAIARYEGDENWATVAALCTACAAIDGQDWAVRELLSNPTWSLEA